MDRSETEQWFKVQELVNCNKLHAILSKRSCSGRRKLGCNCKGDWSKVVIEGLESIFLTQQTPHYD